MSGIEEVAYDIAMEHIDTEAMMAALDNVASWKNSDQIMAGAFLSIIAAYDRNVKRDVFVEMVNDTVWLYAILARLRFLAAADAMIGKEEFTQENIQNSLQILTARAEHRRQKVMEAADLVRKCPPKGVSKH